MSDRIGVAVEVQVEGIPAVRLENEQLRAVILVGKGTDVWELTYKPLHLDVLMKTEAGLKSLQGRDLHRDKLIHYAKPYPGGWQEIVPNRARYGDRDIGQDREGESAVVPWDYEILEEAGRVGLHCRVMLTETPLFIDKTFWLADGKSELQITEEVRNAGDETVHFIWTHHPAFASPLVSGHARVILPDRCQAFNVLGYEQNRDASPDSYIQDPSQVTLPSGASKDLRRIDTDGEGGEGCYMPLFGFETGEAAIVNAELKLELRLEWDAETFPCLRYWSNNDREMYTVALEPSSSRFSDIVDSIRNQDCVVLIPGEKRSAWLKICFDKPTA